MKRYILFTVFISGMTTLAAEIDESAWSMLYTTESIPFEKPSKGRIAVKVINHYGDEVVKVFEV